jgi:hypothetical protein
MPAALELHWVGVAGDSETHLEWSWIGVHREPGAVPPTDGGVRTLSPGAAARWDGLPPGTYSFRAIQGERTSQRIEVMLATGERRSVSIALESFASLTGM